MQNCHDHKMLCTGNKHLNVKQMSNKSNQVADLEARSFSLKDNMKIHDFLVFHYWQDKLWDRYLGKYLGQ